MAITTITSKEFSQQYAEQMSWFPPVAPPALPAQRNLSQALAEWIAAVGRRFVLDDEQSRALYARTTLPQRTTPAAIVQPSTTEEVRQTVRIAAKHGIKWHPVSRGKNWGYGDACAPTDGQVIIDLKRLNRIREVNVELAYAVIEAGVSQGQLFEHLQVKQLPLMMDVTGAGPDASIVGNILQRGFGHTRYGDRAQHCARLEVVLPNGDLLYTGFDGQSAPQAAHVYRWGAGPSVDGLFSQSELGIVTALTLWLMPKPERVEAFGIELQDDEALCRAVGVLRRLLLDGVLASTVHIANAYRVRQHTARETAGPRHAVKMAAWNVCGGIYGNRMFVRTLKSSLRSSFRGVGRLRFFSDRTLRLAERLSPLLRRFSYGRETLAKADAVRTVYALLCGEPTGRHLGEFLRRHETSEAESGLIWISPVIPASRDALLATLDMVRGTFGKYSFPSQITLTFVNPRAIVMVTSITFDKQDPAESARAAQCAAELTGRLEEIGIYCYRRSSHP